MKTLSFTTGVKDPPPRAGRAAAVWIAVFVILFSCPAGAKTELDEPGAIVITAKDELGNPVHGFTARIVLPFDDGKLHYGMDMTATKTDGSTDDDLEKMKHETSDDDVELSAETAAGCVRGGEEFEVTVLTPGLVDATGRFVYATDQVNIVAISQKYVLKIEALDEDGEPWPGFEAAVGETGFIRDGSEQDMDVTKNGIIYFNEDILKGKKEKQVEVTVKLDGMERRKNFTISSRTQKPVQFIFEKEK